MIWIFEDSSKVGMGGGQRVTLAVVHALTDQPVRLIDSSDGLRDVARAAHPKVMFSPVPFRGASVRATSSFSFPAREILTTPIQLARAYRRLSPLVRRERPSVFYCPSRKGFILALLLRWFAGWRPRVVYHAHTALPGGALSRSYAWLVARSSDVVLCVSRFVFRQMRGRRVLLPNPLQLEAEPLPRARRRPPVVGFVGSRQPVKGFDLFVAAGRAYAHRYAFRAFMRDDRRTREGPVEVVSGMSGKEMYGQMDVLLICSRAPEAFSLVAMEAAAFDVPVVFPRQPALLELLVPGVSGEAYDRARVTAIGECLEQVVQDLDAYHPRQALRLERFDPARFRSAIRDALLS